MNNTNTYLILNNLFKTDQRIAELKNYLQNNVLPANLNTNPKIKKFLTTFRNFKMENGKLIYEDKEHKLEVITKADIPETLKRLYDDQDFSTGSGQDSLYFKVRDKYLNIRRSDVANFLKHQPSYQMTRTTRHHINKPIRASQPNERWAIDLIDVGENYIHGGNRYILTCVDYFSRYVWAEPITNKTSITVRDAMETIVHHAGDTYPHIIMKDNGGEFQGELNDWMEEHDIKWINTLSYSPQSNGLIENMNKQLRKILREFMLRNNTLNWVQFIQRSCDVKNSQRNGTTKQFPNKLWRAGHHENDEINLGNIPQTELQRIKAKRNTDKRIQREVAKNKAPLYRNGDLVRVKMTALFSELRKKVKEGNKKQIIVQYSPDVYKVRVWNRNFDNLHEKQQYTLRTLDNQPVLTEYKANKPNKVRGLKRFFATDFLKVDKNTKQPDDFTMEDANNLNKIENGTHLIPNRQAEPEQPDEPEPEPDEQADEPEPEPVETDPMDWKQAEWNDYLKDKTFEDDGRWTIEKAYYSRSNRAYVCDVKNGEEENTMLLWEVLEESREEDWYKSRFDEVIKKLNKSKK